MQINVEINIPSLVDAIRFAGLAFGLYGLITDSSKYFKLNKLRKAVERANVNLQGKA
jgi:hypothetical protein